MTLPTPPTQSKPNPPAPPAATPSGPPAPRAGQGQPNGAKPAASNGVAQPRAAPASAPGAASPSTTDALLARIATALERLAVNTPAPNYKRGLAAFKGFDFARLGIRAVKSDADGPSVLEWNNHYFTRRSGKGKFGVAVWFSRPIGKGESDDEELRFERVITFKDYSEAESLPAEARKGATP